MSDFSIRGNNAAAVLGTQGKQAYASIITETHLRHGRLSLLTEFLPPIPSLFPKFNPFDFSASSLVTH